MQRSWVRMVRGRQSRVRLAAARALDPLDVGCRKDAGLAVSTRGVATQRGWLCARVVTREGLTDRLDATAFGKAVDLRGVAIVLVDTDQGRGDSGRKYVGQFDLAFVLRGAVSTRAV